MALPDPVIEKHDRFFVVRDDLIPGGTKRRVLPAILQTVDADEYVYPSTAYGYGPLALAHACNDIGKQARLIYSWRLRQNWTPMMDAAEKNRRRYSTDRQTRLPDRRAKRGPFLLREQRSRRAVAARVQKRCV